MNSLSKFHTEPFIVALKAFFEELKVPVNYVYDFPATPEGQLKYLTDLTQLTLQGGGEGVNYWEPAWISTRCRTPWGQGSHWDNAIFFDYKNNNEALMGFGFFGQNQYKIW